MVVRVAVIGAGYMGSAHARVLKRIINEYPGLAELVYVVDIDRHKAINVTSKYGGKPTDSIDKLPDESVDFAIIATPTSFHFTAVKQLAEKGVKGFLIEKPMTRNLEEATSLIDLEKEYNLWITVGHIERFNPATAALHKRIAANSFGDILTLVARRVGPFAARVKDTDVVYDLAIHEVDNALVIYRLLPHTVKSYTLGGIVSNLTDYALAVLGYDNGFASIEVNRVTPFKQRILYLTARKGVVFLDYMKQELRFHSNDEETIIHVNREEPLYLEDLVTLRSFADKNKPPVDTRQAFTALYICEKILNSTKRGKEIILDKEGDYKTYSDILEEGIKRYRHYVSQHTSQH
ncbi:Gfo/Idh/MocA family oxidoreductase [Pyrodictium abyssi]|uniref:UDP-N-acetylglucosamine 3-dehydrogenase n=1 Tax=Pyrodictium abyssi TaxID=54256 RepID=A0ABM8IXX9_9CREN|nr:UDP-N-acetylglucosamine 3-dehydrogenase [Pyrodictium abyssi]